jgi:hypothetical protein
MNRQSRDRLYGVRHGNNAVIGVGCTVYRAIKKSGAGPLQIGNSGGILMTFTDPFGTKIMGNRAGRPLSKQRKGQNPLILSVQRSRLVG